jgi:hypothetical protein
VETAPTPAVSKIVMMAMITRVFTTVSSLDEQEEPLTEAHVEEGTLSNDRQEGEDKRPAEDNAERYVGFRRS